jgi:hypothetical protein
VIASLHARRLKAHIPRQVGLFQQRSGSFFHTTSELFVQTGGCTDFECPAENFRLRTVEICVMGSGAPHAETPVDLRNRYGVRAAGKRSPERSTAQHRGNCRGPWLQRAGRPASRRAPPGSRKTVETGPEQESARRRL